jgi:drug/metabolite transporter (DMT)-like permease
MKLTSLPVGLATDRVMLGIGLALSAYSLLAAQDATVKWLINTIPVCEVLFARSVILAALCLAFGGRPLLRHVSTTPTLPLLGLRGAITLIAWFCYFTASRSLPLGQLITLWFTAPAVVTLLAIPLLGETVSRARWAAVSLGFAGTVLAADPVGVALWGPAALVVVAAILWAFGLILSRRIARREQSIVQILANNCFFLIVTGGSTIVNWHPPTFNEMLLLLQVAMLGGIGQFCLFEAARHAPASVAAPLEYTALVWAFLLGFLVWGEIPRPVVFAGATLIVGAGMLLVLSERRLRGHYR